MLQHVPHIFKHLGFYLVGGAVRDHLLGIEPKDLDFATNLTPHQVRDVLVEAGHTVIPTGIEYGVVTVVIDDQQYEVATFRSDHNTDGRHCDVTYGATIDEDLARRDFTINAMAMNMDGMIIDPYGGELDLEHGLIRTVGKPHDRFVEDRLRIIRAARFAARLNGKIMPNTWEAMKAIAPAIAQDIKDPGHAQARTSIERVVMEFDKAFVADNAEMFLRIMWDLKILQALLPEYIGADLLPQKPHYHPEIWVWSHILQVVQNMRPDADMRWVALLHDVGKMRTAEWVWDTTFDTTGCSFHGHAHEGANMIPDISKRLKFSSNRRELIQKLTEWHMYGLDVTRNDAKPSDSVIRRFQASVGLYMPALQELMIADAKGRDRENQWDRVSVLFTPMPKAIKPVLRGGDLIGRGFSQGPEIGVRLRMAYDYQLDAGCTDKAALLEIALGALPPASASPDGYAAASGRDSLTLAQDRSVTDVPSLSRSADAALGTTSRPASPPQTPSTPG